MQLQTLLENKIGDHPSLPAAVVSSLLAAIFMMYPQGWVEPKPDPKFGPQVMGPNQKRCTFSWKIGQKQAKIGGLNYPEAK